VISAVLFVLLAVANLWFGVRPHNPFDVHDPLSMAGVCLVVVGVSLRSWAVGILKKDAELTTRGPYRLIRNPLYVGSFLMMFGFCALIGNPINLLIAVPMVAIYTVKVRQEERLLATLFAADWPQYERTTPRFVPRLAWADLSSNWRLAQWLHAREWQAAGASLLALVAVAFWHAS
jgi:protein-S-isoprenylcysteine O-methyltransferase Ste14